MKELSFKRFTELKYLLQCENQNQIKKWGIQDHYIWEWFGFATEELGELSNAISEYLHRDGKKEDIVNEAIQTATLCLKIAEMNLKE